MKAIVATWLYLASESRASREDTLFAADSLHAVWRSTRNSRGALIPNVGRLRPGDILVLAFRQPRPHACLQARVGKPATPAPGTSAIDRVGGSCASELEAMGYPG